MRESWEPGRFWLSYAARKSLAFDTIFWKYLDERFFGKRKDGVAKEEGWKSRVYLLDKKEKAVMESLTQRKKKESKERILVDWDCDEVKKRMSEMLFDHEAPEDEVKRSMNATVQKIGTLIHPGSGKM
ncbi:hypothetical protein SLS62_005210 [Diatrype stigma]|uniref:Uncharacterized protein n=1 Tax=Diatrype stigma TaxID=117547 RepID=A0AAN9YNP8_9PEZI